jgi:glutaredoxin
VKLYVCWGTFQTPRPPHGHPCHNAYQALRMAGHDPEVVRVHGLGIGPRFMHVMTEGRKEVERLTGQRAVPLLVTDDGELIWDSRRIIEWAEANPEHRSGVADAGPAAR